jgi:hypothetical protein
MSNRAQRRAAVRQNMQAAPPASSAPTISEAQLAANRANAEKSTGPKTEAGKLIASHNAVKTGLTGRTILLPSDDVAAYQDLVALMVKQFAPATDYESHIVQRMADTEWRLLRIPTLESGLLALGRTELLAQCGGDPVTLEILISRTYEKDFRNLGLQERRLRNYLKADAAELSRIQAERLAVAELQDEPTTEPTAAVTTPPPPPVQNGFEFSTATSAPSQPVRTTEIDERIDRTEVAAA